MSAFLEMGGYGAFVWPAYGLSAAVLLGLLYASLRAWRASDRELQRLREAQPHRRGRDNT